MLPLTFLIKCSYNDLSIQKGVIMAKTKERPTRTKEPWTDEAWVSRVDHRWLRRTNEFRDPSLIPERIAAHQRVIETLTREYITEIAGEQNEGRLQGYLKGINDKLDLIDLLRYTQRIHEEEVGPMFAPITTTFSKPCKNGCKHTIVAVADMTDTRANVRRIGLVVSGDEPILLGKAYHLPEDASEAYEARNALSKALGIGCNSYVNGDLR